jgi:hypothetical protein
LIVDGDRSIQQRKEKTPEFSASSIKEVDDDNGKEVNEYEPHEEKDDNGIDNDKAGNGIDNNKDDNHKDGYDSDSDADTDADDTDVLSERQIIIIEEVMERKYIRDTI